MRAPVLSVPVKRFLSKFVYWRLAVPKDTVINLSCDHSILRVIMTYLDGKRPYYTQSNYEVDPNIYNDRILIQVRSSDFDNYWVTFPPRSVVQLNRYLYACMHEYLFDRIQERSDQQIKDVIWNFMHELDIVDDVSYEAIKRAQYRYRERIEKRKQQ